MTSALASSFTCGDRRRLALVRDDPTLNGIEAVEVVDTEAPDPSVRQQTLLVFGVKDWALLDDGNVRVEGGVRRTPITVTWAARADQVAGLASPAEEAYYQAQGDPAKTLVVRVEPAGDYSVYCLRLVQSPSDASPPADVDPVLAAADFSFKVECPADFDCLAPEPATPPRPTAPPIDYLSKDYASFRRLMLDRLSATLPDWTERNPADVGVTIVEALAQAADRLSQYQDAVATEAYLGTARQRISVRRHARLLDYRLHEGCNARAWVMLEVDGNADGQVLGQEVAGTRTRFLTRCGASTLVDDADLEGLVAREAPVVFEPLTEAALYAAHNEIRIHTWGDHECALAAGATRASLVSDPALPLQLAIGDFLLFEERLGPGTGLQADADTQRRHVVRLTGVSPAAGEPDVQDPVTGVNVIEVAWAEQDALPFGFCLSTTIGRKEITNVTVARANIVLADHGRTLPTEDLGAADAPAGLVLAEGPLTHATDVVDGAAADLIDQEPREARPCIALEVDAEAWTAQQDLLGSDRFARDFVVEVDDRRRGRIRFGNGVNGRDPGSDSVQATYRVGNGPAGNVGAGALAHAVAPGLGITQVRNPLPATGGRRPEDLEQARLDAPEAFRVQERAVTVDDYADVTELRGDVQKAVATLRWTGSWHTVFVTVDPHGDRPVDEPFEAELEAWLDRYRMAGNDVEIEPPRYVPLDLALTVCVEADHPRSDVHQELVDRFSNGIRRDGGLGLFHPDNLTFGQPVYLSRIVAEAMAVPGVRWVDARERAGSANRFRRWGEPYRGEAEDGAITLERLEIARLDNDPNQPENGRIVFHVEGGL